MKTPRAPNLEKRREAEFEGELLERARAWVPSWSLADGETDFGRALLRIAARFSSEVAERLDKAGEKMRRGFLDWLALQGRAARPARVPVVFKLTDAAREAALASARTQLQADVGSDSVVFETETDVRIVPGNLDILVGVDASDDAYYLPPPGLSTLDPLEPLPTQWQLKTFAAAGAKRLQLDPEQGLVPNMLIEAGRHEYRIEKVDKDIVTIEPGLATALEPQTVRKLTAFAPFDGTARNRQEHALYLGDMELLNVETDANLAIYGAKTLIEGIAWQYWGKLDSDEEVGWQSLTPSSKQTDSRALLLQKPKGVIEPREIVKGNSCRWIRAFSETVIATREPFLIDELRIGINSDGCPNGAPCPPKTDSVSPAAEGMANTTPLVLEDVFFPLGKEPRQFDAFYLGSAEPFSKRGASVKLCFEMADPTFSALAAVREGSFSNVVLAGVAADRALHLFRFDEATGALTKLFNREPLQPPKPGYLGQVEPGNSTALDPQPNWRLPVWPEPVNSQNPLSRGFLVGTCAGDAVWVWREKAGDPNNSGWISFGRLPPAEQPATSIKALVYLQDATPKLIALRKGQLAVREWPAGANWSVVETRDASNHLVELESLVPVLVLNAAGQLVSSDAAGMVGVSSASQLFRVSSAGVCAPVLSTFTFNADVPPAAVLDGTTFKVVAVDLSSPPMLVASPPVAGRASKPLEAEARVVGPLEVIDRAGEFHFLASVAVGSGSYLASWAPFDASASATPFKDTIPETLGNVGGAPTVLTRHVVIPGTRADALVAEFDLSRRFAANAAIKPGIALPASAPVLFPNDIVVRVDGGVPKFRTITAHGIARDGEVFYPIDASFPATVSGPLFAYQITSPRLGPVNPIDTITLESADHEAKRDSWLVSGSLFYLITAVDALSDPWVVTVTPNFPATGPTSYSQPILTGGRTAPFMELNPSTNGKWDAALLQHVSLLFPGATPERQPAKAFSTDSTSHPIIVVLAEEFSVAPTGGPTFIVDAAAGAWSHLLGDTSTNPELSWEYWNGKGWWKLDVTLDQTLHLKSSGAVQFNVPPDIASSDWAGKTNHWIRARLIGGDYGREQVTVKTSPTAIQGETVQTVERSSEGIRAPAVVKLHISYAVCDGVRPKFVLTQDSGSIRDQSDANGTRGAIVEAFVPLATALERLSGTVSAANSGSECPKESNCGCGDASAAGTPTSPAPQGAGAPTASSPAELECPEIIARSSAADAAAQSTGRALFLGLSKPVSGTPINVLLIVDEEREHGGFAPMKIDALVEDRFVPIVASDATRAIGESGLVSMSFAVAPTPRQLFGRTLTWLRLMPGPGGGAKDWKPALRGAYLNAVWASAAETLTRELLGSSDGSPNLVVKLARPPVLSDTLELRVKEPLGEAERKALLDEDRDLVRSSVTNLPGDWVLWKQAVDPADEAAGARVYALDETIGEIRFGDGKHGAIPPIGTDSIVAFEYRRTEAGAAGSDRVPGNSVGARTALNLISSVESVEAVFAADQAAGGSPAEADERVVRFGASRLRHRERALTRHDIEDLALQSSPDIVQARCFVRPRHVRLVVVMRGKRPEPNAAEMRELRRLLLAAAPASLATSEMLKIAPPRVRRLRIGLKLRVANLDHAGDSSSEVKQRLEAHFDTAIGGADGDGWPLGVSPTEDDIALALLDTRQIEGLLHVDLFEITGDGAAIPWPAEVKPGDLVMLDQDPVRLAFETTEVIA